MMSTMSASASGSAKPLPGWAKLFPWIVTGVWAKWARFLTGLDFLDLLPDPFVGDEQLDDLLGDVQLPATGDGGGIGRGGGSIAY